jgi:glycosyltransferase
MLKISILSAVFNRVETVADMLQSMQNQNYDNIEHIVIDGGSTDGTQLFFQKKLRDTKYISEPDRGIYDALNKGIGMVTGDIIGVLHSDDYFSDSYVLSEVAKAFDDPAVDIVYGDLDYVGKVDTTIIIRRWRAGVFNLKKLKYGWMPPHPSVFLRRAVFERFGGYDISYKIAADYDFILKVFSSQGLGVKYLPRVLVKMRLGGTSNQSLSKILSKSREDYRALRNNKIGGCFSLLMKNFRKLDQFF